MENPEQAKKQSEQAKLSRREAFRRIGFRAGAAVIAALTADDLLRMVGQAMQQCAGDNEVANAVAREFKNAGVAFASASACGTCGCTGCAGVTAIYKCVACQCWAGGCTTKKFLCPDPNKPSESLNDCCNRRYNQCLLDPDQDEAKCKKLQSDCMKTTTG